MDFHLEFNPPVFATRIQHSDKLLLVGSCFTENIGDKLRRHKFSVLENPNGIIFNPASIAKSVTSYLENKKYSEDELFFQDEVWNSWEHHTRFSGVNKEAVLQGINDSQQRAHDFLRTADWLMLTVGSAFVYELENRSIVANCHKVPTDKFNKKLLAVDEVLSVFDNMVHRLFMFNPNLKIIFTISPVRHLRDGFIENNRSKAILIQAIHHLVNKFNKLHYFPAYELVIDDLRDYRFYAEDMVHPNYAATNYVWEKFVGSCIGEPAQELMKTLNGIAAAYRHKAFNPTSAAHKKFLRAHFEKTEQLGKQYPYIDFEAEKKYFGQQS
jgi:hypothetical protein